jgi:hypothetical protein
LVDQISTSPGNQWVTNCGSFERDDRRACAWNRLQREAAAMTCRRTSILSVPDRLAPKAASPPTSVQRRSLIAFDLDTQIDGLPALGALECALLLPDDQLELLTSPPQPRAWWRDNLHDQVIIPFLYQFFVQYAAVLTALVVWDRCVRNRELAEEALLTAEMVMRLPLLSAFLLLALTPGLAGTQERERPVWFWFATCGGPAMTLEVTLDKVTVLKSTIPLCQAGRDDVASQGQRQGRIGFRIAAKRTLTWVGYREERVKTPAGKLIEGSIWQAGADPTFMTLGVSFVDDKQILMNTLHTVRPGQRDESGPAAGLVIRTFPAETDSRWGKE